MRTGHYIRYEENGEWHAALLETEAAKNALTTHFDSTDTTYEDRGEVEIPEADGKFVLNYLD
jgi:hypothetical protein